MTLIDGSCAKWEDGWSAPEYVRSDSGKLKVVLHGTFPKNCAKSTGINVLDRQDYTDRMFRATWRRLGGSFSGTVREAAAPTAMLAAAPADTRLLTEHVARALPEMLRDINKPSDNTLARLLYLSLGSLETDAALGSHPIGFAMPENTAARSEQVVRQWFRRHHIDDLGLVMENGSGLSRIERISAANLTALLQAAWRSPVMAELMSSMPIVGLDGTMRRRLVGNSVAGQAHIKTGLLSDARAMAGYVLDRNGRRHVVVMMVNHAAAGDAQPAMDALLRWVYDGAR